MKKKTVYSLHPSYRMIETSKKNILEKTGRSYEAWVKFAKKEGPADLTERRAWLKKEHDLSTNYAWWIAAGEDLSEEAYDPDGLVEAQYEGKKEALRPLYDRLLKLGFSLGDDVKACPCETMVPLFRKYVFAEIKAATNDRVDLGLALGAEKPAGRLESLGGRAAGNRITHKIAITSPSDVDAETVRWLKAAYAKGNDERDRAPEVTAGGEVAVPPEFAKALKTSKPAKATFDACTPRMRADWVSFITSAAKEETRTKRVGQAIEKLAAGKKKMY
jgi:hypothetical protein